MDYTMMQIELKNKVKDIIKNIINATDYYVIELYEIIYDRQDNTFRIRSEEFQSYKKDTRIKKYIYIENKRVKDNLYYDIYFDTKGIPQFHCIRFDIKETYDFLYDLLKPKDMIEIEIKENTYNTLKELEEL